MSSNDYPKAAVCANCGQNIYIFLSQSKGTEYACNSTKFNDFHKHRDWKGPATQTQLPQATEPLVDVQTAQSLLEFNRTFKLVELTASITRKVSSATIPAIPQYENLSFFVAQKAELELGADVQRILKKLFAEATKGIDQQIIEQRSQFSK